MRWPLLAGLAATASAQASAAAGSSATLTTSTSLTSPGAAFAGASTAAAASESLSLVQNTTSADQGTVLVGSATLTASNGTASSTATAPAPTNTLPCNGSPALCDRKLSNVTFVGAHNSPFDLPNNVASNQQYGVIPQLNDGIRMLQAQVHPVNGTLHMCHTSCDLLDAGPLQDYLANVTRWLAAEENSLEVISILLGNAEYIDVGNFTDPIINSGLVDYAFVPPKVPMALADWPTLSEIILNGSRRALIFMDYQANQSQVNYIMDEFSQMWETPFDPIDDSFPCDVQRPPGLSDPKARNMLYMANHNLNVNFTFLGQSFDIPNLDALNVTNADSGPGSLGLAATNCQAEWGRTPNYLLVDYYQGGNFPGSVFEVAAKANGVPYQNGSCCGQNSDISSAHRAAPSLLVLLVVPALAAAVALL